MFQKVQQNYTLLILVATRLEVLFQIVMFEFCHWMVQCVAQEGSFMRRNRDDTIGSYNHLRNLLTRHLMFFIPATERIGYCIQANVYPGHIVPSSACFGLVVRVPSPQMLLGR